MKIWKKSVKYIDGWEVKKYNLYGTQILKKSKKGRKKVLTFFGFLKIKLKNNISNVSAGNVQTVDVPASVKFFKVKEDIISLDTIKNIISDSNVSIVSFDIFDTLLLRPAIYPTDIFYLIDAKLRKTNKIDFIKYRLNAESEMNIRNATLDDIYFYIQKKYKLNDATIKIMKEAELQCEYDILSRRQDIYQIYQYAVDAGKRIIATSDMYLSSKFLKKVLKKCGYDKIEHIYVSNEHTARKDSGELYQIVINAENVKPHEIVHIGDNFEFDFKNSIKNDIIGIYYPSINNIVHRTDYIYNQISVLSSSPDPMCRILLGYTLNYYFQDLTTVEDSAHVLPNIDALAKLTIAPVLTYIALSLANNSDIQENYDAILFAARDGYLPQCAYDELLKYMPERLPSKYILAGRRAYISAESDDFITTITSKDVDSSQPFYIENLLSGYIHDKKLIERILGQLNDIEKKLDFRTQKDMIRAVLRRFSKELNAYKNTHLAQARKYYSSVKTKAEREIVFDCGYSGSISVGLGKILNKPVDKIYLWETDKNKALDNKHKTHTVVLMHEQPIFIPSNIIYEELFSPCCSGCVGFQNNEPIYEQAKFSENMKNDLMHIKKDVVEYVSAFGKLLKNYLEYIAIYNTFAIQSILTYAMTDSPFNETAVLGNILFPDPVFCSKPESLAKKVQRYQKHEPVFKHTGFENPDNFVTPPSIMMDTKMKLGIHCHLYNIYLYQEILEYLKDFPLPFDLIFTICSSDQRYILESAFTKANVPNLQNLRILVVENRGRDVAPWLVSMRGIQEKYDLFCHIHGKVSTHFTWGNDWRRYLFNNIIKKDAVLDILNIFHQNPEIGCVFPDTFGELKGFCKRFGVQKIGVDNEKAMIDELLPKMNINTPFNEAEMYFSEGTMMWYRPSALAPLFDMGLEYSDFPPEPIGVGGTIAHAIERLPAFVCNHNGYMAKMFTKYKS